MFFLKENNKVSLNRYGTYSTVGTTVPTNPPNIHVNVEKTIGWRRGVYNLEVKAKFGINRTQECNNSRSLCTNILYRYKNGTGTWVPVPTFERCGSYLVKVGTVPYLAQFVLFVS